MRHACGIPELTKSPCGKNQSNEVLTPDRPYDIKVLRPKMMLKKLAEKDCHHEKLTPVEPQERNTWRSGVRSAMRVANQLSGGGGGC